MLKDKRRLVADYDDTVESRPVIEKGKKKKKKSS